jgi:hypothetical protein
LLASKSNPIDNYVLNLKLRDPADAPAFVNRLQYSAASWEDLQQTAGLLVQDAQSVLTPGSILLALLAIASVALAVALAATLVPAIRAAHTSTVRALADVGRTPRRHGVLIRFSRRLPVPMLVGLRLVARRPRRALLSTANMAVTVTGLVAVVSFHAAVTNKLSGVRRPLASSQRAFPIL